MDHIGIGEAAHDVHDGVGVANIGQKLVAQPLSMAGPAHQTGDVHKFDRRANLVGYTAASS